MSYYVQINLTYDNSNKINTHLIFVANSLGWTRPTDFGTIMQIPCDTQKKADDIAARFRHFGIVCHTGSIIHELGGV